MQATSSLSILSIALVVCMYGWIFNQCVLLPAQKENVILEATIISAVANVVLNFILIRMWKENATAFTTLIAEGTMLGICGWKSQAICKIKVFNKNLLTVCVGTAAVVGICYVIRMFEFQSTVELLTSVVLSGIAYFTILIVLKNENVLKLMKKLLKIKA